MSEFFMRQNYEFKEYTVEDFQILIKNKQVILPRFQRDLVWTSSQIEDLALSLKIGIPFGIFLLAGKEPFRLLDGLQRSNAILKIYEEPQLYFNKSQVEDFLIINIIKLIDKNGGIIKGKKEDEIGQAIEYWVRTRKDTDPTHEFKGYNLAKYLFARFSVDNGDFSLFEEGDRLLSPLISDIHTEIKNIGKIKIPCIIYKGNEEYLPLIFEKLNSTGTRLSRFQIFAANWVDKYLPTANDTRIKKIIYDEYIDRQDEGKITIENLPDEKEFLKQDLNLYEYLVGLGKVLEDEYKSLFDKKGDSIGFTLSAACLLGSIRKIINIQDKFSNTFDFEKFQNALHDSIKIVLDQLRPYICLRINKSEKSKKVKPIIFHSEYQIISFVAKVFRDKYDLNSFEFNENWKRIKDWVKFIPYHYLYDQLEENWKGSGDKRIEDMLSTDRYQQPITKDAWKNVLNKWFTEKELTKKQSKRPSIDNEDLLFLNYIYTHVFTHYEVNGRETFHLEHLVPVKKLTDFLSSSTNKINGLPISAVSNLCYLSAEINTKKGKKTIYQFVKDSSKEINIFDIEEKCTFTEETDLEFVELLVGNNDEGWNSYYEDFLKKRFNVLVDKFIELNEIR